MIISDSVHPFTRFLDLTFISPYKEARKHYCYALYQKNVENSNTYEGPSLVGRVTHLVVALTLIIPVVNSIVFAVMKFFSWDIGHKLIQAVENNDLGFIQKLLELGISPNYKDWDGVPVFLRATQSETLQLFLDAGVSLENAREFVPQLVSVNRYSTLIFLLNQNLIEYQDLGTLSTSQATAVMNHEELHDFFIRLLKNGQIEFTENSLGQTLLEKALAISKQFLWRVVHEGRASIDLENSRGYTLLHLTCLNNDIEFLEELLEAGADPNKRDPSQRTAIGIALYNNNNHLITNLINRAVDVNVIPDRSTPNRSLWNYAFANNNRAMMLQLLLRGLQPTQDVDQFIALNYVLQHLDPSIIWTDMARAGWNLTARNNLGKTFLDYVYEQGNYALAKKLVENGANLEEASFRNGHTFGQDNDRLVDTMITSHGNPLEKLFFTGKNQMVLALSKKISFKQFCLFYTELLENYPRLKTDWLWNILFEIDTSHFSATQVERSINAQLPEMTTDIDLNLLPNLFDSINFSDPSAPNYTSPQRRTFTDIDGEKTTFSASDLRRNLTRIVNLISNRLADVAAPSAVNEPVQFKEYYDKLELYLKHVLICLQKEDVDEETKANVLIDLAYAGGYCTSRWCAVFHQAYCRLSNQQQEVEQLPFADQVRLTLEELRFTIAQQIAPNISSSDVHFVRTLVNFLRPIRGVFGEQVRLDNFDHGLSNQQQQEATEFFDRKYRPTVLLNEIHNLYRSDVNFRNLLADWFCDQVADLWLDEPYREMQEIVDKMETRTELTAKELKELFGEIENQELKTSLKEQEERQNMLNFEAIISQYKSSKTSNQNYLDWFSSQFANCWFDKPWTFLEIRAKAEATGLQTSSKQLEKFYAEIITITKEVDGSQTRTSIEDYLREMRNSELRYLITAFNEDMYRYRLGENQIIPLALAHMLKELGYLKYRSNASFSKSFFQEQVKKTGLLDRLWEMFS